MSRTTAASVLATLALIVGWMPATAQTPAAGPCPVVTARQANVSVDGNAQADPACLTITKGKTSVVWQGTADVKLLVIAFKDAAAKHPPDDPACTGAQCVLEKAKHASKQGEFEYSVVVVRQDGTTATVDPKLIILPEAP